MQVVLVFSCRVVMPVLCDVPADVLPMILAHLRPRNRHALRACCSTLYRALPADGTRLRLCVFNAVEHEARLSDPDLPFWGAQTAGLELYVGLFTKPPLEAVIRLCERLSLAGASFGVVGVCPLRYPFSAATYVLNAVAQRGLWPEADLELRNHHGFAIDLAFLSEDVIRRLTWCDAPLCTAFGASPPCLPSLRHLRVAPQTQPEYEVACRFGLASGCFPALQQLSASCTAGHHVARVLNAPGAQQRPPLTKLLMQGPPTELLWAGDLGATLSRAFPECRMETACVVRSSDLVRSCLGATRLEILLNADTARSILALADAGSLAIPNARFLTLNVGTGTNRRQLCREAAAAVLCAAPAVRELTVHALELIDAALLTRLLRPSIRRVRLPAYCTGVDALLGSLPRDVRPVFMMGAFDRTTCLPPGVLVTGGNVWHMTCEDEPEPENAAQYSSVSIAPEVFTAAAGTATASAWTHRIRRLQLSAGVLHRPEAVARLFPRLKTLVVESKGVRDEELDAWRRLAIASGPGLRRVVGASAMALRDDPGVRRACPWVLFSEL